MQFRDKVGKFDRSLVIFFKGLLSWEKNNDDISKNNESQLQRSSFQIMVLSCQSTLIPDEAQLIMPDLSWVYLNLSKKAPVLWSWCELYRRKHGSGNTKANQEIKLPFTCICCILVLPMFRDQLQDLFFSWELCV